MKCPNDQTTLLITDRSGIEVDYCPECRGVWLDRGELDKIIERGATIDRNQYERAEPRQQYREEPHYREDTVDYKSHGYEKKKRRESFLGDIFDF